MSPHHFSTVHYDVQLVDRHYLANDFIKTTITDLHTDGHMLQGCGS